MDEQKKFLTAHEQRMLRHQKKDKAREQQMESSGKSKNLNSVKKYAIFGTIGAIIIAIIIIFITNSRQEIPTIGDYPSYPGDPKVNIIIFGDFQCPFTKAFWDTSYKPLLEAYKGKANIAFRPMPTRRHKYDVESIEAAYCANDQGKFWEYADVLFARQGAGDYPSLKLYANQLELDTKAFNECIDSGKYKAKAREDYSYGGKFGIAMTPTVFVNSYKLQGELPLNTYRQYIDFELSN